MYLRELLRLMLPRFHQHLLRLGEDGLQLLFCHRWILLCFKREFPDTEALRMWEACWAHYQVRAESTACVCETKVKHVSSQRGNSVQQQRRMFGSECETSGPEHQHCLLEGKIIVIPLNTL